MEELVLYNAKAMHQMKNVHLLAVEHAAVLEVVIPEQFGSDNQSMIYKTLMTQLIYYIHSLILCASVSVLCETLEILGTGYRDAYATFANDHPCSCTKPPGLMSIKLSTCKLAIPFEGLASYQEVR